MPLNLNRYSTEFDSFSTESLTERETAEINEAIEDLRSDETTEEESQT